MRNVVGIHAVKDRQNLAAEWLMKAERGLSPEEQNQLYQWFDESPENLEAFLKAAELWDKMDSLSRLSELFPLPSKDSHRKRKTWQWGVAAAVALVCSTLTSLYFAERDVMTLLQGDSRRVEAKSKQDVVATVYETAIGEHSQVTLADGSSVILNTNSLLTVRLGQQQRILSLERGEVHVDVAHDTTRPLSVVAGNSIVQAVGTTFAVKLNDAKKVDVIVTAGKVLVGTRALSSTFSPEMITPVLPSSSLAVQKGEAIRLGEPAAAVHAISAAEIEDQLSWREGNLIFRGETLEDAMTEIGRYTTTQFVFVDESLKQEVIAGRFKAGDVEGLLAVLRENIGVVAERTDDGRVFLSHM
ncbi:MAG: transmembrane sensor [Candidatus Azotimanducaceae bacterium]|jgi:transmembrane sensor